MCVCGMCACLLTHRVEGRGDLLHRNPNLAGQLCLSRPHQTLTELLKMGPALPWYEQQQLLPAILRREELVCQLLKLVSSEHALLSEDGSDAVHIQFIAQHRKVVLYPLGLPPVVCHFVCVCVCVWYVCMSPHSQGWVFHESSAILTAPAG